jgi:uncharacterized protein DUF3237
MATSLNDNLPEVLKRVRTQPLFVMRLDVRKLLIVGATPGAYRRIGVVPGGSFEGERLSGEVLDGGSDWQTVRNDGTTTAEIGRAAKGRVARLVPFGRLPCHRRNGQDRRLQGSSDRRAPSDRQCTRWPTSYPQL